MYKLPRENKKVNYNGAIKEPLQFPEIIRSGDIIRS